MLHQVSRTFPTRDNWSVGHTSTTGSCFSQNCYRCYRQGSSVAYRNLNPNKFEYLLALGTHEGELKKFFVDSKRQLILRHAKVQNLPYGRLARVRAMCERLPRETDEIV